MKILVVGGGTAGLVTALILKRKLDAKVDIVRSKEIGTVGVGEGSTEHFRELINVLGVDQYQFMKETNATYKSGIKFSNWNPRRTYYHSVSGEINRVSAQYAYIYGCLIGNNDHGIQGKNIEEDWISSWFLGRREDWPFNQYHFNTHMMGETLTGIAEIMGIEVFDDEITGVNLNSLTGNIDYIDGKKRKYNYDFYIDSTGFRRILMDKLGAKWRSFAPYLKMKAAMTFQTEHEPDANFPITTLAHGMDYGWMFKIPTWDHIGNGYIYDSDYISADQAKEEVEKLIGKEITIGKQFSFDPGCLEKAWIKNCVAVGLSGSFVEPLEATSIGSSIQQAFLLAQKISNYDDGVIENYNNSFESIMNNIRDYIAVHYLTERKDTQFWIDAANNPLPNDVAEQLKQWKHKLPIQNDFTGSSNYIMFTAANFIMLMEGLDLFDRDSIRKEFMMQNPALRQLAMEQIEYDRSQWATQLKIPHRRFIEVARDTLTF